jgi:hypothetical protein
MLCNPISKRKINLKAQKSLWKNLKRKRLKKFHSSQLNQLNQLNLKKKRRLSMKKCQKLHNLTNILRSFLSLNRRTPNATLIFRLVLSLKNATKRAVWCSNFSRNKFLALSRTSYHFVKVTRV